MTATMTGKQNPTDDGKARTCDRCKKPTTDWAVNPFGDIICSDCVTKLVPNAN